MPERGWSNLTVRDETARKVKQIAHASGLTVDKFLNRIAMAPAVAKVISVLS